MANYSFGGMIQARLGSSRLPQKVLKKIRDVELLKIIAIRLSGTSIENFVVSTSLDKSDDPLEDFANRNGFLFSRAALDDIVQRMLNSINTLGSDYLVRLWGDSPFVCADIVEQLIDKVKKSGADYGSTFLNKTTFPSGLDVEIYSRGLIERIDKQVKDDFLREFPFDYVKENSDVIKVEYLELEKDYSDIIIAVDYQEDFEKLVRIDKEFNLVYENQNFGDLIKVCISERDFLKSNLERDIEYKQKKEK